MAGTIITVKPTVISGRRLAHNKYDSVGRAFLAVDLYDGARMPVDLTMTQSAYLARANVTYCWWAKRRQSERAAIEAGSVPLVPYTPKAPKPKIVPVVYDVHDIDQVYPQVDDEQVLNIVRAVGSERLLSAMCVLEAAQ